MIVCLIEKIIISASTSWIGVQHILTDGDLQAWMLPRIRCCIVQPTVIGWTMGPCKGNQTGEDALFRQLYDVLI
jgi:hypothetical protein